MNASDYPDPSQPLRDQSESRADDRVNHAGVDTSTSVFPVAQKDAEDRHTDSFSVDPASGGAAAFPDPSSGTAPSTRTTRGRKPINPNQGKDLTFIGTIVAGRVDAVDRKADRAGIIASKRLFLGRSLASCANDLQRVQVLGGIALSAYSSPGHTSTPLSIDDAFERSGAIKDRAAVPVFGRWLMLDGAPGLPRRRGKPMDTLSVLKLVAAVAHHCVKADRLAKEGITSANGAPSRLTDAQLAKVFHAGVGEEISAGAVKSLRLPAAFALQNFLDLSRDGRSRADHSPLLTKVLAYLEDKAPTTIKAAPKKASGRAVANSVRAGHGFTLAARYNGARQAALYRGRAAASLVGPEVAYIAAAPSRGSTSPYQPDVVLTDYRVIALFDRIWLRVVTTRTRSARWIKSVVDRAAGINAYVDDKSDSVALEATSTPTAGCYVIKIQEPTPVVIKTVLAALDLELGLIAEPEITLLELSLDFPVRELGLSADELLHRREQMVTILHRHHQHWLEPKTLPQGTDRRQTFTVGERTITRPLYEHRRGSVLPVSMRDLSRPGIGEFILTTQPEEIFLNSTVYDGLCNDGVDGVAVSIQHKIADRRHPKTGAFQDLPDTERRPRIEVCLSGDVLHETFGIRTLADLTRDKLRTLKRKHLSMFLPTLPDEPVAFAVEAERFARGGVDTLDLYQRAKARKDKTRAGTGKHGKLLSWSEMNDRTGEAIDRLAKAWERS